MLQPVKRSCGLHNFYTVLTDKGMSALGVVLIQAGCTVALNFYSVSGAVRCVIVHSPQCTKVLDKAGTN